MILGIESAISGGSLCLLESGEAVAEWIGDKSTAARAETLLVEIEKLVAAVGMKRTDLRRIAVSAGPGSFTGIRIGIATALGLSAGLRIPVSSVPLLESIALVNDLTGTVLVPMGRGSVCTQRFVHGSPVGPLENVPEVDIAGLAGGGEVLGHPTVAACLPHRRTFSPNMAVAVARFAELRPDASVQPLFLAKV